MSVFDPELLKEARELSDILTNAGRLQAQIMPIEHEVKDPRPKRVTSRRGAAPGGPSRVRIEQTGVWLVKLSEGGALICPTDDDATHIAAGLNNDLRHFVGEAVAPIREHLAELLPYLATPSAAKDVHESILLLQKANAVGFVVQGKYINPANDGGVITFKGDDARERATKLAGIINAVLAPLVTANMKRFKDRLTEIVTHL